MKEGRPTLYNEDILIKAREYLDSCEDVVDEFHKTRGDKSDSYERIVEVEIPSIEGLSYHLKVSRETIYAWEKEPDKQEFSDILEELRVKQAKVLINKGLSGDYNPVIARLLLGKHGYVEKRENDHTTGGKPIILASEIASKYGINTQSEQDS